MMKTIIEEGTRKMMKSFIDYYKLNLQLPMFKPYIDQILLKVIEVNILFLAHAVSIISNQ